MLLTPKGISQLKAILYSEKVMNANSQRIYEQISDFAGKIWQNYDLIQNDGIHTQSVDKVKKNFGFIATMFHTGMSHFWTD